MNAPRRLYRIALVVAGLSPVPAGAQLFTQVGPLAKLGAPVALDTTGMFQSKFARVGDDVFIAGQPSQQGLREMRAQGVTTVVNLRTPEEMARIGFDEPALIGELGVDYVFLPVRGSTAYPYAPETVTRLAEALRQAKGKVLLHCTVAWRASHLFAAYLIQERGVPIDTALAYARAINLADDRPNATGAMQPVEEFLGRTLPTLRRAAPSDH